MQFLHVLPNEYNNANKSVVIWDKPNNINNENAFFQYFFPVSGERGDVWTFDQQHNLKNFKKAYHRQFFLEIERAFYLQV